MQLVQVMTSVILIAGFRVCMSTSKQSMLGVLLTEVRAFMQGSHISGLAFEPCRVASQLAVHSHADERCG